VAAAYKDALLERLNERTATVAVVGLGYVGLPLACALAEAGHSVIGVDLLIAKA
jgi:UDP-N-acetyl-D-glucosamine dehydrogenase